MRPFDVLLAIFIFAAHFAILMWVLHLKNNKKKIKLQSDIQTNK